MLFLSAAFFSAGAPLDRLGAHTGTEIFMAAFARIRLVMLSGVACSILAACGADGVASPGEGVIVIPAPIPTPTPTPTPTTTTTTAATAASTPSITGPPHPTPHRHAHSCGGTCVYMVIARVDISIHHKQLYTYESHHRMHNC